MTPPSVFFVGGGTGGHVIPAIAMAEALRRRAPGARIHFVGGRRGIEGRLVPAAGFGLTRLPAYGLRGLGPAGLVRFALGFLAAVPGMVGLVLVRRPRLVIATGGYAAAAPGFLASLLRIPLWLQEQNSAPGSTNRVLARRAERAYVAFSGARALLPVREIIELPNPVRAGVRESASAGPEPRDYEAFGLEPERRTLLVFGGSRGAATLNRAVEQASDHIAHRTEWQVLAQTGVEDLERTRTVVARACDDRPSRVRVLPFIEEMGRAWKIADLVVCRAGAMTLAELATVGRPAVLVPYPHATDDHQRRNAQELVDREAARMVEDGELDGERLVAELAWFEEDARRAPRMAAAVREWGGGTDAADRIATDVLQRLEVRA
jgi:UDP-N-acetylglucosamine--N-acetylmuramyl-(pentapeptide) pyrophosphoryl-undecaprenol N-acetylglucosamine transferase